MKVYIVSGNTGEYSDFTTWMVKAFSDRNKAQEFIDKLHEAMGPWHDADWLKIDTRESIEDALRPFDPLVQVDYTGTYYTITELELV